MKDRQIDGSYVIRILTEDALRVMNTLPSTRELSAAKTKVDEAVMWMERYVAMAPKEGTEQ